MVCVVDVLTQHRRRRWRVLHLGYEFIDGRRFLQMGFPELELGGRVRRLQVFEEVGEVFPELLVLLLQRGER